MAKVNLKTWTNIWVNKKKMEQIKAWKQQTYLQRMK